MTCSEGAPLQCMEMRDVQLNELCELEEHSNGCVGAKLQNVWLLCFGEKSIKNAENVKIFTLCHLTFLLSWCYGKREREMVNTNQY